MAYNNLISRSDSSALIKREDFNEIMKAATHQSACMQVFRKVPVSTNQSRVPVLDVLPSSYWVSPTDSGRKQTTEANWTAKYINIEEIAAIIPVPITVAEDIASGSFSLNAEVLPLLAEAMAVLLDDTIINGTSTPATWPSAIATAAAAAGNTVARGTNAASKGGYVQDVVDLFGKVEEDGFEPTAIISTRRFKKYLRASRDTTGQKLMDITGDADMIMGIPLTYASPDVMPITADTLELVVLDARQFLMGVRQEMRLDVFNSGVITDAAGLVLYNLMQDDLTAVRVTMRVGWVCANAVNRAQATEADRYPAAYLKSPA